jgi:hypothetical protein
MAYVGPMKTADNYRMMIYGPKEDGAYVVEFRTDGQVFALSIPRTEAEVIRRFVPPVRRKLGRPPKK